MEADVRRGEEVDVRRGEVGHRSWGVLRDDDVAVGLRSLGVLPGGEVLRGLDLRDGGDDQILFLRGLAHQSQVYRTPACPPLVEGVASSGFLAEMHRSRAVVAYYGEELGEAYLRDHFHDGTPHLAPLAACREGNRDGMVEVVQGDERMAVEGICRLAKEACGEASSMEEVVGYDFPFHALVDHKYGSCLPWGA